MKRNGIIRNLARAAMMMVALVLATLSAEGQMIAEADTLRTPTEAEADSLRKTDGFVTASMLVATPGEEGYSALGHCALRMECPVYGLDYCFSFESNTGRAATDYLRYFRGRTPAGFIAMETPFYLERFQNEGRGVVQYTLNLNPQQKQELWRRLDENMMEGISTQFDFLFHNCTSMCLIALESQLMGERMEIKEWPEVMQHSAAYACLHHTRFTPWMQFGLMTIMGTRADTPTPKEHCVAPEVIGEVMEHAVIVRPDGTERPALLGQPQQLLPQTLILRSTWFTPLLLATILLVLVVLFTLGEWFWGWRRVALGTDVALLVVQALLGVVLLYVVTVSNLFGQHWNWCLLLFTPLPLVVWACCRRRTLYRRLALLYGAIMLVLAIAAPLITAQFIAAHRLTSAAVAVRSLSCAAKLKWNRNKLSINSKN